MQASETYLDKLLGVFLQQGFSGALNVVFIWVIFQLYRQRVLGLEQRLQESKDFTIQVLTALNTYTDSIRQLTEYLKARDK